LVTSAPAGTGRNEDGDFAGLRDRAVDELVKNGTITSSAVEAAMRSVPRHLFIPEAQPEEAYDPFHAVVTKRDEDGNALSSVSDMHVQAWMLEQARLGPGMNVLEVGSGGYNAALLAEIAGPSGRVTTVDIDPFVTDRSRELLAAAGYPQVRVVLADADEGVPDGAPYDAVLVTFGAWDVPLAWPAQLADDGRLVTALRVRGLQRTIAFAGRDGCLESTASKMFGFVMAQGAGAHQARLLVMRGGEVTLRFDDDDFRPDPAALEGVFGTQRAEVASGARIGVYELLDTMQMWLATSLDGFCVLLLDRAKDTGVVTLGKRSFAMAAVDGGNLAYVTTRPAVGGPPQELEFLVHAYGPQAGALAEKVAGRLRTWAASYRGGPGPTYRIYPAGAPGGFPHPDGPSRVVGKARSQILISWPEAAAAAGPGTQLA
jgi:protein-L-isoaspartate(D-aspartate) O-methyltransferase